MRWLSLFFLFLLLPFFVTLSSAAGVEVAEGVITTGVTDRQPVDIVQTYPATVERLYCFTEIAGAAGETTVTHVWYFGNQIVSQAKLPVRSSSWRTWSALVIRPEWVGEWRVEVLDAEGNLLQKIPFRLTRS